MALTRLARDLTITPNPWRTDRWETESLANRANAIRPYDLHHHRSQSK